MKTLSLTIFLLVSSVTTACLAWGVRGHESICEAAAKLVRHPQLSEFLTKKSARIGYLCDVPDLQWRVMSQNYKEHRLNPESLGTTLKDLSLDYKELMSQYPDKSKVLGSNWWRAEQFYRRATSSSAQTQPLQFLLNLGFMGHFVGDISQPLHLTADYDGYQSGHGGIHFYYEELVVHYIPGDLPEKIIAAAKTKLQNNLSSDVSFLAEKKVLEKIRALALLSHKDEPQLLSLDPLIQNSSMERGLSLPAKRATASNAVTAYEPMIVNEMANSALLLAQLWDSAYEKIGQPNFSELPPPQLPLVFKFIPPDYID